MEDGTSGRWSRILLIWLTLCGVALIAAAWWYYLHQKEAVESSALAELAAIAEFKAKQLSNWRLERLGDGTELASIPVVNLARKVLSPGGGDASDRGALLDALYRCVSAYHYAGAVLVDREGRTRLEVNLQRSAPEHAHALQAASSSQGKAVLSDLYLDTRSKRPWMSLVVPMADAGAVILDIDPFFFLYPYVQSWPTPSPTGETLLVQRDGNDLVYLSESKHAPGGLLRRRALRAVKTNLFLNGSTYRGIDERGVPVMGVVRKVPGSTWLIVTKIDVAEVNQSLRRLVWRMLLVIALLAATGAAAAGLIWRSRQLRIYRDREAAFRQIADGTPAYLWMASADGRNTFINQEFARFLGVAEDRLDMRWGEYLHPDDRERIFADFTKCLESRSPYRTETRVRRSDGVYRWAVFEGIPRYSPDGEFVGYAGAFADVTGWREAEQQLRDVNQALASELRERTRSEKEVRALSARLINAQEDERKRLARELHDDLSQQIAAVSIAISTLKKHIPPGSLEAMAQSSRIQQKLTNLAGYIRRLSHELHPSVLQHSGLAAALRNYCAEFATLTSHRIKFRAEGSCEAATPAVALCVYRVAQEALQNSIRHSQADEAEVVLSCTGGVVCLTVSDRGIGMGPDAARGLGLVSIKERTRLVNGTVEVRSQPGEGVVISLRIPIPTPGQPLWAAAGVEDQFA